MRRSALDATSVARGECSIDHASTSTPALARRGSSADRAQSVGPVVLVGASSAATWHEVSLSCSI